MTVMPRRSIPYEFNRRALELTLALYRVTESFPGDEPLRAHMRAKANETFEAVIEYGHFDDPEREIRHIIRKIETLKGYFRIAQSSRITHPVNLAVLEREYESLGNFLRRELESVAEIGRQGIRQYEDEYTKAEPVHEAASEIGEVNRGNVAGRNMIGADTWGSQAAKPQEEAVEINATEVNERQKMIIEYLRAAGSARAPDFMKTFSSISSKTIQRDLQDLVSKKRLQKLGEKRWTTYFIS